MEEAEARGPWAIANLHNRWVVRCRSEEMVWKCTEGVGRGVCIGHPTIWNRHMRLTRKPQRAALAQPTGFAFSIYFELLPSGGGEGGAVSWMEIGRWPSRHNLPNNSTMSPVPRSASRSSSVAPRGVWGATDTQAEKLCPILFYAAISLGRRFLIAAVSNFTKYDIFYAQKTVYSTHHAEF